MYIPEFPMIVPVAGCSIISHVGFAVRSRGSKDVGEFLQDTDVTVHPPSQGTGC